MSGLSLIYGVGLIAFIFLTYWLCLAYVYRQKGKMKKLMEQDRRTG